MKLKILEKMMVRKLDELKFLNDVFDNKDQIYKLIRNKDLRKLVLRLILSWVISRLLEMLIA